MLKIYIAPEQNPEHAAKYCYNETEQKLSRECTAQSNIIQARLNLMIIPACYPFSLKATKPGTKQILEGEMLLYTS